MDVTMKQADENNLLFTLDYETADKELADINGPPVVASSNPFVASVLSQDDSTKHHVVVYELHPLAGTTMLSVKADADLTNKVPRYLTWEFELNVVADEAASFRVSAGELIPKL